MTRIHLDYIADLSDRKCEPRHVATVIVNELGATVEYLDARELEQLDRLAVLTIPEQVRVTCAGYREDFENAALALELIYAHGNVWARRVEG